MRIIISLFIFIMLICMFTVTGCNTTFEQRKVVYAKAWEKIAPVLVTAGKIAAEKAVDKYEADGKIDKTTAEQLKTKIKNYNSKKESIPEASQHPNIGYFGAQQAQRNGATTCHRYPMRC